MKFSMHDSTTPTVKINYTEVCNLDLSTLVDETRVLIYLDKTNLDTRLTTLRFLKTGGENGSPILTQTSAYVSPIEFATVSMKEVLTLYVKRKVVSIDPVYYVPDDPKLHGFISKLSYEGIKYVAEHVIEFADAFKQNKVNQVLNIPKSVKAYRS